MPNTDRYKKAGYETREDYLNDLAVRYCVNPIIVSGLAGILGDEEDFDGLVSAIEDMRDMIPRTDPALHTNNMKTGPKPVFAIS